MKRSALSSGCMSSVNSVVSYYVTKMNALPNADKTEKLMNRKLKSGYFSVLGKFSIFCETVFTRVYFPPT